MASHPGVGVSARAEQVDLDSPTNRTGVNKAGRSAVRKTRVALRQRAFPGALGKRALVGRGCRRRHVRLLGETALALRFSDVAHRPVKVGVRTVGRVSDHAGDDERGVRRERGNFLVARDAFVLKLRFGFGDCRLGIERVLERSLVGGISSNAAEFNGRRKLRPRRIDRLSFGDCWINF